MGHAVRQHAARRANPIRSHRPDADRRGGGPDHGGVWPGAGSSRQRTAAVEHTRRGRRAHGGPPVRLARPRGLVDARRWRSRSASSPRLAARRHGARSRRLPPAPRPIGCCWRGSTCSRWAHRGRCRSVLSRPDRRCPAAAGRGLGRRRPPLRRVDVRQQAQRNAVTVWREADRAEAGHHRRRLCGARSVRAGRPANRHRPRLHRRRSTVTAAGRAWQRNRGEGPDRARQSAACCTGSPVGALPGRFRSASSASSNPRVNRDSRRGASRGARLSAVAARARAGADGVPSYQRHRHCGGAAGARAGGPYRPPCAGRRERDPSSNSTSDPTHAAVAGAGRRFDRRHRAAARGGRPLSACRPTWSPCGRGKLRSAWRSAHDRRSSCR